MNKLYFTVGVSGSGKSTYAMNFAKENNLSYVSSDLIRQEICGDINCQDYNREVFGLVETRILYHIARKRNVIFDATNYKPKNRKFLQKIRSSEIKLIAICLDMPFDVCKVRNNERERKVPLFVLENQFNGLKFPDLNEVDEIIKINN